MAFIPQNTEFQIPNDTIHINGYIDLLTFCETSDIDFEELKKLNPQITKTILPDQTRDFVLKVPSVKYTYLMSNRNVIMDSCTRRLLPSGVLLAGIDSARAASMGKGAFPYAFVDSDREADDYAEEGITKIKSKKSSHTVKRGETLQAIARRYDVAVSELKRWNHMRKNAVKRGQRLVFYKDVKVKVKPVIVASAKPEKELAKIDTIEKVVLAENEGEDETEEIRQTTVTKTQSKKSSHIVKRGRNAGINFQKIQCTNSRTEKLESYP